MGRLLASTSSGIHLDDVLVRTGSVDAGVRDRISGLAVLHAVDHGATATLSRGTSAEGEGSENRHANGEEIGEVTHGEGDLDDFSKTITRY
jgi:hypothetical protein